MILKLIKNNCSNQAIYMFHAYKKQQYFLKYKKLDR